MKRKKKEISEFEVENIKILKIKIETNNYLRNGKNTKEITKKRKKEKE